MSTVRAAEPSAVPRPDGDVALEPRRRGAMSPWILVAGLYALAAIVYGALALHSPLPVLFPDEFRYSHLARSLADGQGFEWRGEHIGQSAALYVYFITPAYALFSSTVDAYHASKLLGTLALCTQLVPTWWLARELVGPRLALIPAVLSVAGTWMLTSAETVTEVLAFPLATAALCVAVMALRRPGSRLGWLALLLLVLATWARIQLAVLVPALLAAFLLDALRAPAAERAARLRAHRPYLATMGLAFALLVVVALAAPGVTGDYRHFFDLRPPLGSVLSKTGLQLLELVALTAFAPVLLALGAAASGRAWRDERVGPLLAVFWPAALALALQSGFFLAGYPPAVSSIGRYVSYVAPLALVLATVLVARTGLLSRTVLAVAALGALTLLARPAVAMMGEERATWSTAYRVDQVLGVGTAVALTLVALVTVAVVAALARRGASARAAVLLAVALGAVLVVQSQASWWQMVHTGSSFRTTMPDDLEWVDHHASGPVALLGITQNAPQFDDLDFFNRKLTQAYGPAAGLSGRRIEGRVCSFQFAESGAVEVQPECGPTPHRFFINDPSARVTFQDEIASASHPTIGRIAEVAPSAVPRARSLVVLPCPRRTPDYHGTRPDITPPTVPISCRPALTGALWLDGPGRVAVRYRGGAQAQTVTVGTRRFTLPAGRETTIAFPAPKGYSQFSAQQDWTSSAGTPHVLAVTLTQGARTTPLA